MIPHSRSLVGGAGLAAAVVCGLLLTPAQSLAQGCVPAKLGGPCPGGQPAMTAGQTLVNVSFRSLHSFRDFQGSKALPVPATPDLYASTHVNTVDVTVAYAATDRLTLTVGVPFQIGTRRTYYEHDFVSLHTMRATGLGDVRATGSVWLFDPASHRTANVAVTAGVKMPTGASDASDDSFRAGGTVRRPVDPAIQLGDGGWGILLGGQAHATIAEGTMLFVQGTYLMNPRETNGTQSPFGDEPALTGGDPGYITDSVPDQYFMRIGFSRTLSAKRGAVASLNLRLDGVPPRDLVGGSEGYRLPGYSLAVEPGLTIGAGKQSVAFTVPIAVRRHVPFSIADLRTGNPIGGIAALADVVFNVSYARRF